MSAAAQITRIQANRNTSRTKPAEPCMTQTNAGCTAGGTVSLTGGIEYALAAI